MRNLKSFPVVAVTGARQTGKTTLIRHLLDSYDFVSLDNLNTRQSAMSDPKRFVESLKDRSIIDEIQYAPDLLPYIKLRVDGDREKRGNFVLTGSQRFLMMKGLSETLAGRIGIINLYPFSAAETENKKINTMEAFSRHALVSSYPEPLTRKAVDPGLWYNNYINTYIEKDVKSLYEIGHAADFSVFLKLLALRTAQMLNMSSIASEVKVSVPTIKKWLSVLEASNIIYFLRPYHANLRKRLVKTPKVFFYDTAMACRLSGITNGQQLYESGMLGAFFENFCIIEARKRLCNNGSESTMNYLRTNLGLEIDLVLEKNRKYTLLEIKASKSISFDAGKNMNEAEKSIFPKGSIDRKLVVTLNDETGILSGNTEFCGLEGMYEALI